MTASRLRPEIKERWVAALRSGAYKQGQGHLRWDGQFCCLGVLCDLAEKDGVVHGYQRPDGEPVLYDGQAGYPPDAVVDWAYENRSGEGTWMVVDGTNGWGNLADFNDAGRTFAEIANIIEAGL